MENIKIFENQEFGKIRMIVRNNNIWFVGKDVAEILGYSNTRDAINKRVDTEDKMDGVAICDSIGRSQKPVLINESGLYGLILSSKLDTAKKFKRWVTSEVLPSIRKHGGYIVTNDNDTDAEIMAKALFVADRTIKKKNEVIEKLIEENQIKELRIAELQPVKDYVDEILKSEDTMTITQIAADYGKSARELNKILNKEKLIYKVNDQWILYKKHMNKGYTKSETFEVLRSDGTTKIVLNTKWTQKGRLKIHEILEKVKENEQLEEEVFSV